MYWIYLSIFILMVSSPLILHKTSDQETEALTILFLGSLGFMAYLWQEWQSKKNLKKRMLLQRESSMFFQNLNEAYLYIGEINRKIEILKNISISAASEKSPARDRYIYGHFIEALKLFANSKDVLLRFIHTKSHETLKEFPANKKSWSFVNNKDVCGNPNGLVELEKFIIIKSPNIIKDVQSIVVLSKSNSIQKIDDPLAIKALAAQALSYFSY